MNDNDLNEMIKKAQYMIQNNQIPDDIKNLVNNFQNQNNSSNENMQGTNNRNFNMQNTNMRNSKTSPNYNGYNNYNSANNFNTYNNGNNNNSFNNSTNNNTQNNSVRNNNNNNGNNQTPNIDMETLLKLQNIMSKMKNSSDDDMSRLLLSLKPYLRNGKKEKIDEYIQLIKMGKMTQILNSFGGEKK